MISPETEQLLTRLQANEPNQQPSEVTRQWLQHVTLVGVVSPSTSGKNTIIDGALASQHTWHYVPSVTTRPKQERDALGSYREYIPHDDDGIATIYDDIQTGKLLQYAINPHSQHIMATYLSDYSGEVNVKDLYASAVDSFRALGFGLLLIVSLVTPYELWKPRFDARFPNDSPERTKRLQEAVSSATWSASQKDAPDHFYVINDGTPAEATQKLLSIVKSKAAVDLNGADAVAQFKDRLEREIA